MPDMDCHHTDDVIERAALGMLSTAETSLLADRLATCRACRLKLDEYRAVVAAMPSLTAAAARPIMAARGFRSQTREETPTMDEPTLPQHAHSRPPVLPPAPTRRGAILSALAAVIVVAALIGAFATLGPLRGAGQGAGSTSKGPIHLTATPIHIQGGQLTLGAAPTSCSGAPTPRDGVQAFNGAIGQAPFWIGTFTGPHATLLVTPGDPSASPHGGLPAKVLVHVGDGFTASVTLSGKSLDGKTRLWFNFTTTGVTQTPAFGGSGLHSDTGYIYIPAAGCYSLTASWPAGSWTLTFGAGGF